MAENIKKVDELQNSEGLNQDELILQDIKEKLLNEIYLSGGNVPTLRDDNGNILLYTDPQNPNNQLEVANQWINVEILNQRYDNVQSKEILDMRISELYKSEDSARIKQLLAEIERLKQLIRELEAGGGSGEGVIFDIPDNAFIMPDFGTGDIVDTGVGFSCNTAIFNSDTQQIDYINIDTSVDVEYMIINRETKDVILSGKKSTQFFVPTEDDEPLDSTSIKYDLVLKLSNVTENFDAWYYYDTSNKYEPFYRITEDQIIRIELNKMKQLEATFVNLVRNLYPIYPTYRDEAPSSNDVINVNISYGSVAGIHGIKLETLDDPNNVAPTATIQEIDVNNKIVQEKTLMKLPLQIKMVNGNKLKIVVSDNLQYDDFYDWYIEAEEGVYNATNSGRTYYKIIERDTNLVAGYIPMSRD